MTLIKKLQIKEVIRMKKVKYLSLLILMIGMMTGKVQAASIPVKLAEIPVTINGQRIDNSEREYPLISYNHMIYFPLTKADSRFLALETRWDEKKRELSVQPISLLDFQLRFDDIPPYLPDKKKNPHQKPNLRAERPNFKIKIRGRYINPKEEGPHPFLLINGITYLPLTRQYGEQEFGGMMFFSQEEGLQLTFRHKYGLVEPKDISEEGYGGLGDTAIRWKKWRNEDSVFLRIEHLDKEKDFTDILSERLYPEKKGFSDALLNQFWLRPPAKDGKKAKIIPDIQWKIRYPILVMPLAQNVGGTAKNSVIKINLETMELLDIIPLSMDEALHYDPEKYLSNE